MTSEKWQHHRAAAAAEARARVAEQALADAQARLAQAGVQPDHTGATPPRPPGQKTYTESEMREMARREAMEIAFTNDCNDLFSKGLAAHEDWRQAIDGLKGMTGGVLPRELVESILSVRNSHEVLYHLAKNPQDADRILSLDPRKQIGELTEIAIRQGGSVPAVRQAEISAAPPPAGQTRLGGSTNNTPIDDLSDPNMPVDKWMKLRQAEVDAQTTRH